MSSDSVGTGPKPKARTAAEQREPVPVKKPPVKKPPVKKPPAKQPPAKQAPAKKVVPDGSPTGSAEPPKMVASAAATPTPATPTPATPTPAVPSAPPAGPLGSGYEPYHEPEAPAPSSGINLTAVGAAGALVAVLLIWRRRRSRR